MNAGHPITMSPELWNRLSAAQRAAVMDAARQRAQQLRTQALHDAAAALLGAAARAWRSARRSASPVAVRPVARA